MDCNVFILRAAGVNCDVETAAAFRKAGARTEQIHINKWLKDKSLIHKYQILALPGGFSYGDDLGAGTVLANELRQNLMDEILHFVEAGKLIIGICNGFQVLVKTGLLPGLHSCPRSPVRGGSPPGGLTSIAKSDEVKTTTVGGKHTPVRGGSPPDYTSAVSDKGDLQPSIPGRKSFLQRPEYDQEVSLTNNDSAKYEDRWVYLKNYSKKCVFTSGITKPLYYLPVAHGEGKFIPRDKAMMKSLIDNDQVVFRYTDKKGKPTMKYPANPNGATDSIAGICDPTGRILGLMPHPERFQDFTNHPRWTRERIEEPTDGMLIFLNAVKYIKSL